MTKAALAALVISITLGHSKAHAQQPTKASASVSIAEFDNRLRKADTAFRRGQSEMGFHNAATAQRFLEYATKNYNELLGIAEGGGQKEGEHQTLWQQRAKKVKQKADAATFVMRGISPGQVQRQKVRDTVDWTNPTYNQVYKFGAIAKGKTISWNVVFFRGSWDTFLEDAKIDPATPHCWAQELGNKSGGKILVLFSPELIVSAANKIGFCHSDEKGRITGKVMDVISSDGVIISVTDFHGM